MQRMIIGHQGSGKTRRAMDFFKEVEADISIFLDTKRTFSDFKHSLGDVIRIQDVNEIDWDEQEQHSHRYLVLIDPDTLYFDGLIEVIESYCGMHGGPKRKVHLSIDEAYIYTMQYPQLCERMTLWARGYYDIDWISQRVQMMRTTHGSTIFTQIDQYIVFFINKFEQDYLKEASGLELSEEEAAWISPTRVKLPYHYITWNNIIREYFNEKGEKCTKMTCPCRNK